MKREILTGIGVGALLASSLRVFVAGVYSSVEKTFFYGVYFPSILGIVLLILATALVARIPKKIGGAILGLYIIATLATDATEYTHLLGALAIPIILSLTLEVPTKYLALGMLADLSLRVLATGGEPLDFYHTRVLLVLLTLPVVYYTIREEGKLNKAPFELYAFATLIELGLIYPNAILRYSGIKVYYLPLFVGYSFIITLALFLGIYLGKKPKIATILLILGSLTLLIKPLSLIGLPIALLSSVALLDSARNGKIPGVLGPIYFTIMAILATGAYIGRDIGLSFMEDRLEVVIILASMVYALTSYKRSVEEVSLPTLKEIAYSIAAFLIIGIITLSAFHRAPVYQERKSEITVWTYNIHQGFGPYKGTFNGKELVDLLKNHGPDIIGAQEVVGGMIANAYQDIPLLLSARLGYDYEYKPAVEGTYGVAVFSKYPMKTLGEMNLKSVGQARPVQKVLIEGLNLVVVNVHLGLSEEERAMQAEELLKFATTEPKAHIILGDLNAEPKERAIEILMQEYRDSFEERPPFTFNWGNIDIENIDYIMLRKEWNVRVKDYGCLCEVEVSDHRALWVVIEI
ncbi:endonuclease/exonuclease/phosphatase family protein [Pyrococcus woesei]|uniref:endonuclease/exonuclease/phosphatase family protein n=1 Tax=Pyrococcus woesei TaxID=2262 RepID=UPI003D2F10C3